MTKSRRLWLVAASVIGVGVALALVMRHAGTPNAVGRENRATAVAREYVTAKEGWPATSYVIENTGELDANGNLIVNVIHEDDTKGDYVGGGKSVQLHIDIGRRQVVKVLHFQ